jgi:tetratricopeptide (TPR) repeat protein
MTSQQLSVVLRTRRQLKDAEEFARSALDLYQDLTERHPRESKYRTELASTQSTFGNFLRDMGRLDDAERMQRQSINVRQQLIADFPNEPDFRRDLARNFTNLGVVMLDLRRLEDAENAFRESLRLREELVSDHAQVAKYREDLALGFNNLGVLLEQQGRFADAEPLFRRGLPHHRQLADDSPSVPQYRKGLAWNLENLGIVLEGLEQWPEAEAMHKEGLRVLERLCQEYPDNVSYVLARCQSCRSNGRLLRKLGQLEASVAECTKAAETLETLLAKNKSEAAIRESLYNTYFDRATALDDMGKYSAALSDWDRAIELSPDHYRDAARLARGTTLVRAGDSTRAVTEAAVLTAPETAPIATLYNGAEVYSLASAVAKDDPKLAEEHAQHAVALLKRAVGKGYSNWRKLKSDPPFAPLRPRADFQHMVAELELKSETGKK